MADPDTTRQSAESVDMIPIAMSKNDQGKRLRRYFLNLSQHFFQRLRTHLGIDQKVGFLSGQKIAISSRAAFNHINIVTDVGNGYRWIGLLTGRV